jgi:hypothetical protein
VKGKEDGVICGGVFNNRKVQTLKFDLHPLDSGMADLECIRDNHVKSSVTFVR